MSEETIYIVVKPDLERDLKGVTKSGQGHHKPTKKNLKNDGYYRPDQELIEAKRWLRGE